MDRELTAGLLSFIQKSPTAYHAVTEIARTLRQHGFTELFEGAPWAIVPGGNYFVTRNGSSILGLRVGGELENYGFQVAASHCDSPTFKIKENAELEVRGKYTQLNTESYGKMLCAPWLDRPLSVAGRAMVREGERCVTRLVNLERDLVLIPSLAVHMNRRVNEGYAWNKQVDMLPLFSCGVAGPGALNRLVAGELGVSPEDIMGSDLYLYNRTPPSVWGAEEEFLSSPQLDDLQCVFTSLQGFLRGSHPHSVTVFACFDNEEVGSSTKQGAGSTFLRDTLWRVNAALGKGEESYYRALANSFLLSCDNAHAVHPNHPEKTDANNCVYLNEGVVVKHHAGQKYTSDGVSVALFRELCRRAEVPLQYFANRSDAEGGHTLGNIAVCRTSMNALDVGLPQLAMHSCYETAGVRDGIYMVRATEAFFNAHFQEEAAGIYRICG